MGDLGQVCLVQLFKSLKGLPLSLKLFDKPLQPIRGQPHPLRLSRILGIRLHVKIAAHQIPTRRNEPSLRPPYLLHLLRLDLLVLL